MCGFVSSVVGLVNWPRKIPFLYENPNRNPAAMALFMLKSLNEMSLIGA